jgi:hypothetical protein
LPDRHEKWMKELFTAFHQEKTVRRGFAKGQGHNYWEESFRCQELIDFTIAQARAGKDAKGEGKE